ncbi:MAG: hypothetical protein PHG08_00335 [Bacilli bacterium]|nr:hypothetical protein [Bacilli bacterium]
MIDSLKNISSMLPDYISTDYPLFVEFMTAYYSFLNQSSGPDNLIKNVLSYKDIDETIDSFKTHIFNDLLLNIPDTILANRTLLAKHIKELYNKKGTEDSYRLLFRIIFNKEIDINYPGDQVLKLSDGKWEQKTSFTATIPSTVSDEIVKSAIGRKVLVEINNKNLPVLVTDIVRLDGYDPHIDWYESTPFPEKKLYSTTSILSDGRILIAGGTDGTSISNSTYFGTVTENMISWVSGTNLPVPMSGHTTSVLSDGRILIAGGNDSVTGEISILTYIGTISGNTISWVSSTNLPAIIKDYAISVLDDGRLIISGGTSGIVISKDTYLGTVALDTISWVSSTDLITEMINHTSSILHDGRIFLVGGNDTLGEISKDTYMGTVDGNTINWVSSTKLPINMFSSTTTILDDGRVLVAGGTTGTNINQVSYIGTVTRNSILWINNSLLLAPIVNHTTVLLNDGRVILAGGNDSLGNISKNVYIGKSTLDANLYEFFIKKDFFDDFSSATSINFKYISSITINNPGIGYLNTDEVRVLSIDGGRTNIDIVTSSTGSIINTIINDGGIGFIDIPTLNIISDKGKFGYLTPILSNLYTGIISTSISNVSVLKSSKAYIEGKSYHINYDGGSGAILQIKHNDINRNVKNISILSFGKYYPDNFNCVINKDISIAEATPIIYNGSIVSLNIINGGFGYTTPPIITIYGDGINANITTSLTNGVVTGYNIINGGFGYNIPPALIFSEDSLAINVANNKLRTYDGIYVSTDGFVSSDMIIYDGIYYQKYSYEIVIDELFNSYKPVLKKLLHPAGYELWGIYNLTHTLNVTLNPAKIDIEKNNVFNDIVYYNMKMVFDINSLLDDIYDTSTIDQVIKFNISKSFSDITDTSTYVEALSISISTPFDDITDTSTYTESKLFDINKKLDDITDTSTYTESKLFDINKKLDDISIPITFDINNSYTTGDYFSEEYLYIRELSVVFGMGIISDNITTSESLSVVID